MCLTLQRQGCLREDFCLWLLWSTWNDLPLRKHLTGCLHWESVLSDYRGLPHHCTCGMGGVFLPELHFWLMLGCHRNDKLDRTLQINDGGASPLYQGREFILSYFLHSTTKQLINTYCSAEVKPGSSRKLGLTSEPHTWPHKYIILKHRRFSE